MKKVLIWILIVLGIAVAADIVFGLVMKRYISDVHLKGDYRSLDHILRETDDELVVVGSSVALNSFDTKTIGDSLGIKAFNVGSNGQYLPFTQTIIETIVSRPKLKHIILAGIDPNFADEGFGDRFNFLMPYYGLGYESIDRRLEQLEPENRYLLRSSLYRYNTIWFRILLYELHEPGLKGERGFIAKEIPPVYPTKKIYNQRFEMTPERSGQLDSISALCRRNGVKLTVCLTPQYVDYGGMTGVERTLREKAARGDFELWVDTRLSPIASDSTLFYDESHINYKGTELYTPIILGRIR